MISIQWSEDPKKRKGQKALVYGLAGAAAIFVFLSLFGMLVQWLWNSTIAEIFGISTVTFWQAIGLLVLAKLFFGFGGGSGSSPGKRRKKRRSKRSIADTSGDAEDQPPGDDEQFRRYWSEEGRGAWEAWQAERSDPGSGPGSDPK